MKTMTVSAAILAAGMALAPMAASATSITFDAETIPYDGSINIGSGSGSMFITAIIGQNTPSNAGQGRRCTPDCLLNFQTGELLSFSTDYVFYGENQWPSGYVIDEWKWKGGGFVRVVPQTTTGAADITLLTGRFVEPATETLERPIDILRGNYRMEGILANILIDEDLAAYYGVPNRGTGEFSIRASDRLPFASYMGTVTFSPVPVPAALPLMLTALAGLGLIQLRRTQTA